MAKSKNESNNKNSGTLLTEKDGTQYFVMGKVRIKVCRKGSNRDNKRSKSRNDAVPFFRFGVINTKLFCGAVCKFFWRPQTLDIGAFRTGWEAA